MGDLIGLEVDNVPPDPGGQAVAYVGETNALSLSLINDTGGLLNLTGLGAGEPVPEETALVNGSASTAAVYFGLSGFAADQSGVAITAKGWQEKAFGRGTSGAWWVGLAPSTNVTMEAGNSVEFSVTGLQAGGSAGGNATIRADCINFSDHTVTVSQPVLVGTGGRRATGSPPPFGLVRLETAAADPEPERNPNHVYLSDTRLDPIENSFVLVLGRPFPGAGAHGAHAQDAVFTISIVVAEDYDPDAPDAPTAAALTTRRYASGTLLAGRSITVTPDKNHADDWTPKPPDFDDDPRPTWTFKPRKLPRANETVRLTFEHVRIPHVPRRARDEAWFDADEDTGLAEASFDADETTYLFVQYDDVPGYGSGYLPPVSLEKRFPQPKLNSFDAMQPMIEAGEQVALSWSTTAVDYVMLTQRTTHDVLGPQKIADADGGHVRNTTRFYPVTPTETTEYQLKAYGLDGRAAAGSPQIRSVAVRQATPAISNLTVSPPIVRRDAGEPVTLQWSVTPPDAEVWIDNNLGIVTRKTSITTTVNRATKFTLTASAGNAKPARATFDVFDYTCTATSARIGPNPFMAFINNDDRNILYVLDQDKIVIQRIVPAVPADGWNSGAVVRPFPATGLPGPPWQFGYVSGAAYPGISANISGNTRVYFFDRSFEDPPRIREDEYDNGEPHAWFPGGDPFLDAMTGIRIFHSQTIDSVTQAVLSQNPLPPIGMVGAARAYLVNPNEAQILTYQFTAPPSSA